MCSFLLLKIPYKLNLKSISRSLTPFILSSVPSPSFCHLRLSCCILRCLNFESLFGGCTLSVDEACSFDWALANFVGCRSNTVAVNAYNRKLWGRVICKAGSHSKTRVYQKSSGTHTSESCGAGVGSCVFPPSLCTGACWKVTSDPRCRLDMQALSDDLRMDLGSDVCAKYLKISEGEVMFGWGASNMCAGLGSQWLKKTRQTPFERLY